MSTLSGPEKSARGRIAIKTRFGLDPEPDRREFAELKARRELVEAAERLVALRPSQGLQERVEDPATIARIAGLLVLEPTKKTADAITPPAVYAKEARTSGQLSAT